MAKYGKLDQTREGVDANPHQDLMRNGQFYVWVAWLAAGIRCFQVAEYNSSVKIRASHDA